MTAIPTRPPGQFNIPKGREAPMPLDEEYFLWLYSQVGSVENKNLNQTYWKLLRLLFMEEFTWTIDRDSNRAHDGTDLRYQFMRETNRSIGHREKTWMQEPCSFLEMLYALAYKLAFESLEGATPAAYFWEMIGNIGLSECTDMDPPDPVIVKIILEKVMNREYADNGAGGLFPLNHSEFDQRERELWYQAQDYLLERL